MIRQQGREVVTRHAAFAPLEWFSFRASGVVQRQAAATHHRENVAVPVKDVNEILFKTATKITRETLG